MEPRRTIVVIDAGHGGSRPAGKSTAFGTRGPAGTSEKDVTFAVASAVARSYGAGAVLTRSDDRNLSLAERCERARRDGAAVFVSLHADARAAGERGARAFTHPRASSASRALAQGLAGALGGASAAIETGELAVLSPEHHASHTAACLLELDNLTDAAGESRLRDPGEVARLGQVIAAGIRRFCGAAVALDNARGLPNLCFGPPGPGGRPLGAPAWSSVPPLQGQPVQITWAEHNLSDTMAGSFWYDVWVTDAEGRIVFQDRQRSEGVPAGGSVPRYAVWTPSAPGTYVAHVKLNTGEYAIPEDRLDDNEAATPPATTNTYQGRRFGRGTVAAVNNNPPRAGRRRSNGARIGNFWDNNRWSNDSVPNNEITFELVAEGVEPGDGDFRGPVDAEVTVTLTSASDGTQLGRHSCTVVERERGYVTFTGSPGDPIDPLVNYEFTVYNRINPQATVNLRVFTWT